VMNQIYGVTYIYANKPFGYGMMDAKELYILPNNQLEIRYRNTGSFPQREVAQYILKTETKNFALDPAFVYCWNDEYVGLGSVDLYAQGQSRLYSLANVISANTAAYHANNKLLVNYGALGIISSDKQIQGGSINLQPNEVDEIQTQFRTNYGIIKQKWDVIFSNAALKWQAISKPLKDLMLMETIEDTTRVISEAYNYPMHLLGFSKGTTFSNVQEARKSLYEEAIIPESLSWCSFVNGELGIEEDDYKLRPDYSNVEALKQTKSQEMDERKKLADILTMLLRDGVITIDEYKEKIKLDEL